ncbi:MAG: hypothetical protein PHS88_03730 [Candidatus Omnitrophica bacterium]|nr:hypothetical protein [Candidatus Omnitrophota bacterium]
MRDKAISLILVVLLVGISVMAGTGTALAKQNRPPVPAGMPNWDPADGPPGSVGGPGSEANEGSAVVVKGNPSVPPAATTPAEAAEVMTRPGAEWWIPTKPYELWKKDKLEAQYLRLQEFQKKLTTEKPDDTRIALINDQIRQAKKILDRTF